MPSDKSSIWRGITRNVVVLGLVSFFNDIASEMVYPVVPIFLTTVLGAPVAIVGLIEGIAESTASLLKVVFGALSDRMGKRKPFAAWGYTLSTASKLLIGLATSWPFVLAGRFFDRFGKGVRTPARDALIAESTPAESRGRSFGLHRALDQAGAVIGPLLALLFLYLFGNHIRPIFFIALVPGAIGVILLLSFVREMRPAVPAAVPAAVQAKKSIRISWRSLDPAFKIFLVASIIFAIGNSSDVFLILRAKNLGLSTDMAVLAYTFFNFIYVLFSFPAGWLSDRIGAKKILLAGFVLFAFVYWLFGAVGQPVYLWLLFPFYGIYMAMTEGVGKAYISGLVRTAEAGTAFGVFQTATGICVFFSSLVAGLLWSYVGVSAPFVFGSIVALLAAAVFGLGLLRQRQERNV